MLSMKKAHILALAALALSSCKFGPNFLGARSPEMPASWVNNMPPVSREADLRTWWNCFGDPQLTRLIDSGFANNPDMVTAAIGITRAETELRATYSSFFPSASIGFGGSNGGSYNTSTSHGGWDGSLSASWSPDIWGRTRRQVEAAFANIGSAQAAAAATRTALAASIATAYFEWISAKESLRFAREQLVYQERTFAIVSKRVAAGFQSALDLAEAQVSIANTRAQIPAYIANIQAAENALAIYLGVTVDQVKLTMPSSAVYNRIPRVPTGLPSELLRRRPDIIRAEFQLHQATAAIGVQVANLFPSISISGRTGASSGTDFANFFKSAGWSLSGSVSQTIFNRTQLRANVKLARLAQQESAQAYRKTVLAAFAEVESRLIEYARLTNQLPQYEQAARAGKQAADLALRLYNEGSTNYLNVASAERSWLNAELNLISTRQQIRISLARLCTALGGGWTSSPPEAEASQPVANR